MRVIGKPFYLIIDRGYKTPCWIWQRGLTTNGYARISKGRVHIIYYKQRYGPVPNGLELDHLCKNKDCVNPDHLEAVTRRVNTQRGRAGQLGRYTPIRTVRTRID